MKSSIISRLVLGYGIIILIVVLMVFTFAMYITIHKVGRSERVFLDDLVQKAQNLSLKTTLQISEPTQDNFISLTALHNELINRVRERTSLPDRLFLPERFYSRFSSLRQWILSDFHQYFENLQLKYDHALQVYIIQSSSLLKMLNDYRVETDLFRNRLLNFLIVIFCFLALVGGGTIAVYFFFYLPDMSRDYRRVLSLSRDMEQGALENEPSLSRERQDEIGDLFEQLKKMFVMKRTFNQIQALYLSTVQSYSEVEEMVTLIYDSIVKQADLLENISSNFNEIVSAIKGVHDNARSNLKTAEESSNEIENSTHTIMEAGDDVHLLEEQTTRIEEVTLLIGDIADQTDLLALNAAIEAARAGEFGRGFHVVAMEIQKLADKSSRAASEIADLVQSILDVVNRIAHRSNEANMAMGSIKREIARIARSISEVISTSETASVSIDQVNSSIDSIMNLTLENLGNADEIVKAYRALRKIIEQLSDIIKEVEKPLPASGDQVISPGNLEILKNKLNQATQFESYAVTIVEKGEKDIQELEGVEE